MVLAAADADRDLTSSSSSLFRVVLCCRAIAQFLPFEDVQCSLMHVCRWLRRSIITDTVLWSYLIHRDLPAAFTLPPASSSSSSSRTYYSSTSRSLSSNKKPEESLVSVFEPVYSAALGGRGHGEVSTAAADVDAAGGSRLGRRMQRALLRRFSSLLMPSSIRSAASFEGDTHQRFPVSEASDAADSEALRFIVQTVMFPSGGGYRFYCVLWLERHLMRLQGVRRAQDAAKDLVIMFDPPPVPFWQPSSSSSPQPRTLQDDDDDDEHRGGRLRYPDGTMTEEQGDDEESSSRNTVTSPPCCLPPNVAMRTWLELISASAGSFAESPSSTRAYPRTFLRRWIPFSYSYLDQRLVRMFVSYIQRIPAPPPTSTASSRLPRLGAYLWDTLSWFYVHQLLFVVKSPECPNYGWDAGTDYGIRWREWQRWIAVTAGGAPTSSARVPKSTERGSEPHFRFGVSCSTPSSSAASSGIITQQGSSSSSGSSTRPRHRLPVGDDDDNDNDEYSSSPSSSLLSRMMTGLMRDAGWRIYNAACDIKGMEMASWKEQYRIAQRGRHWLSLVIIIYLVLLTGAGVKVVTTMPMTISGVTVPEDVLGGDSVTPSTGSGGRWQRLSFDAVVSAWQQAVRLGEDPQQGTQQQQQLRYVSEAYLEVQRMPPRAPNMWTLSLLQSMHSHLWRWFSPPAPGTAVTNAGDAMLPSAVEPMALPKPKEQDDDASQERAASTYPGAAAAVGATSVPTGTTAAAPLLPSSTHIDADAGRWDRMLGLDALVAGLEISLEGSRIVARSLHFFRAFLFALDHPQSPPPSATGEGSQQLRDSSIEEKVSAVQLPSPSSSYFWWMLWFIVATVVGAACVFLRWEAEYRRRRRMFYPCLREEGRALLGRYATLVLMPQYHDDRAKGGGCGGRSAGGLTLRLNASSAVPAPSPPSAAAKASSGRQAPWMITDLTPHATTSISSRRALDPPRMPQPLPAALCILRQSWIRCVVILTSLEVIPACIIAPAYIVPLLHVISFLCCLGRLTNDDLPDGSMTSSLGKELILFLCSFDIIECVGYFVRRWSVWSVVVAFCRSLWFPLLWCTSVASTTTASSPTMMPPTPTVVTGVSTETISTAVNASVPAIDISIMNKFMEDRRCVALVLTAACLSWVSYRARLDGFRWVHHADPGRWLLQRPEDAPSSTSSTNTSGSFNSSSIITNKKISRTHLMSTQGPRGTTFHRSMLHAPMRPDATWSQRLQERYHRWCLRVHLWVEGRGPFLWVDTIDSVLLGLWVGTWCLELSTRQITTDDHHHHHHHDGGALSIVSRQLSYGWLLLSIVLWTAWKEAAGLLLFWYRCRHAVQVQAHPNHHLE